jgi:hypothetical protein
MMPMEKMIMENVKRTSLADVIEDKELDGVDYIKMTPGPYSHTTTFWGFAHRLTVADWRVAQQVAIDDDDTVDGDDVHNLRQFRMATLVLAMAEQAGLPEDAIAMPTLGYAQSIEVVEATPQLHTQGADGIWRRQKQLTQ